MAAVFRPKGTGPFPVVVALHGSSGLSVLLLAIGAQLAAKGFIVVAGCYLNSFDSPRVILPCPTLKNADHATLPEMRTAYEALLAAAVAQRGVRPGALGALGISQGAILALTADEPRVKAIVADSGYREGGGTPTPPVLLLGRIDDPNVMHSRLVAFEAADAPVGARSNRTITRARATSRCSAPPTSRRTRWIAALRSCTAGSASQSRSCAQAESANHCSYCLGVHWRSPTSNNHTSGWLRVHRMSDARFTPSPARRRCFRWIDATIVRWLA